MLSTWRALGEKFSIPATDNLLGNFFILLTTRLDCQVMIAKSDPGGSCRPPQLQKPNNNKRAQSVYFSRSIVILPNFALKGKCMQPLLWNVNTAPQGHRGFLKNTSPIPPGLRPLIMPHSSKPICLCQVCAAGSSNWEELYKMV